MNAIDETDEKRPLMTMLRRRVYALESRNLHLKKGKKDDPQMVDDIIRTIGQTIDEWED